MKNKIIAMLSSSFIILLLVFLVIANLSKPRILILHSYNLDFSWVQDINEGLLRVLKKKPYSIKWHYMDTKRHPSEEFKQKAGETVKDMIKKWKPDILLAVDDNAQKYVAVNFKNSTSMNIIFTGVNAELKAYGYDKAKNVTGVLERIPFEAFKEVFLQVLPEDKRRIVHISDASTSSHYIHEELELVNWTPLTLVKSFQCETFAQWKKAIRIGQEIGNVMLITHYHTIKSPQGRIMKPRDVIKWTEANLKIPDVGAWGFFVEDGGMMAVAVSPYEQGEMAAKMAVDIIENGKRPSEIPVFTNKQYVVYIRGESIKSRKIKLPKILEAFARATNHYYE